jgi:hypothetical protein
MLRKRTAKRETIQILCGPFVHRVREKVVHNLAPRRWRNGPRIFLPRSLLLNQRPA